MRKEKKEEIGMAINKSQRAQAILEKLSEMRRALNQEEFIHEEQTKQGAKPSTEPPVDDDRPKVFCKDCKFLRRHQTSMGWEGICTAIQQERDYWYGRRKEYPIQPGVQNKDNHCSMFKKKPFWRRGVKKIKMR